MRISDWSSDVCSSDLLVLDRRYLIEEDPAAVKQEIVDLLDALKHDRKGFDYALREVLAFQPTMTDPEAPVVRAVSAAIELVLRRPARQVVSPGTYDQTHNVLVGLLEDCLPSRPGILDLPPPPAEHT